jgi:hypothetical protein
VIRFFQAAWLAVRRWFEPEPPVSIYYWMRWHAALQALLKDLYAIKIPDMFMEFSKGLAEIFPPDTESDGRYIGQAHYWEIPNA